MSESKYFGNCKLVTYELEGKKINKLKVGLNRTNLEEMLSLCNEKGWINLEITQRKEVGQYGDTHSIKHDDWIPSTDQAREGIQSSSPQVQHTEVQNQNNTGINLDDFKDLPF